MSEIKRFEDLDAWQVARELAKQVYALTRSSAMSSDRAFVDQVRRAAVSIVTNIAEGYERGSNKEFVRFLFIARGSVGEVRSLLYVALDQGYICEREFEKVFDLCVRQARIIWGLIRSLRSKVGWITGLRIIVAGLFLHSA